ncbi:hypothetical protein CMO88_02015 [Candidatus Woesearchaeota archaeon]|nr:hypothetical protein [Candidatus Woesearchaeota archaeon]|tara:strand:- start:6636 stop:6836 length:201 start_codon:yes stop_codon:yes gene_type:complete
MSYATWANSKIQKMQFYDVSLVKLSSAAFALWIAKIWAPLLSQQAYVYLIVAVVAALIPMYKVFKK